MTDFDPYELVQRCVPSPKTHFSRKNRRAAGRVCDEPPKPSSAPPREKGGLCASAQQKGKQWKTAHDRAYVTAAQNQRRLPPMTLSEPAWPAAAAVVLTLGAPQEGLGDYCPYFRAPLPCSPYKSARPFSTKPQAVTSYTDCSLSSPVCIDNGFQLLRLGTNTAVTGTTHQLSGWKSGSR